MTSFWVFLEFFDFLEPIFWCFKALIWFYYHFNNIKLSFFANHNKRSFSISLLDVVGLLDTLEHHFILVLFFFQFSLCQPKTATKSCLASKDALIIPTSCSLFRFFFLQFWKTCQIKSLRKFVKISFQFYWHHYCCSNRGAQWVKISIFVTWVVFESHHFFK